MNEQETEQFAKWLAESHEHRMLYHKIKSYQYSTLDEKKYETWKSEYMSKIGELKSRKRKFIIYRSLIASGAAAAVLLIAVMFTSIFNTRVQHDMNLADDGGKVRLQLADGRSLYLSGSSETDTIGMADLRLSVEDRTLTYAAGENASEDQYNILSTERGGDWTLVLEDGTKVYLNSSSILKYPVAFTGDKRQVYLQGEAYFEVAHDADKPFTVHTDNMDIRVLGTSFNVNAYPDVSTYRTTLVNGKIEVACSGNTYTVMPGQQLVYEKEASTVRIMEVDTDLYASWRTGFYKFNDTRLEDILNTLSLRYDVNVVYIDESVKDLRFTTSGKIARDSNLMTLLKKFEHTDNVRFELSGKKLTVKTVKQK